MTAINRIYSIANWVTGQDNQRGWIILTKTTQFYTIIKEKKPSVIIRQKWTILMVHSWKTRNQACAWRSSVFSSCREAQSCFRRAISRESLQLVSFVIERKLPVNFLQYASEKRKKEVNQSPYGKIHCLVLPSRCLLSSISSYSSFLSFLVFSHNSISWSHVRHYIKWREKLWADWLNKAGASEEQPLSSLCCIFFIFAMLPCLVVHKPPAKFKLYIVSKYDCA